MTKTETAPPWLWAVLLMIAGAAVMVANEIAVGVKSFRAADHTVMLGALPVDALQKVALGGLAGFLAFGGCAVTAWLFTHDRAALRRQARIAAAVTFCASAVAVFNLADSFSYYRRSAEAPHVAASAEFATAQTTYREVSARLAGQRPETDGAGFAVTLTEEEEIVLKRQAKTALATIKKGEAPTGGEIPGLIDTLKALLAHLLGVSPAAAFRLPAPRKVKKVRRTKAAGKPKVVGGTDTVSRQA